MTLTHQNATNSYQTQNYSKLAELDRESSTFELPHSVDTCQPPAHSRATMSWPIPTPSAPVPLWPRVLPPILATVSRPFAATDQARLCATVALCTHQLHRLSGTTPPTQFNFPIFKFFTFLDILAIMDILK